MSGKQKQYDLPQWNFTSNLRSYNQWNLKEIETANINRQSMCLDEEAVTRCRISFLQNLCQGEGHWGPWLKWGWKDLWFLSSDTVMVLQWKTVSLSCSVSLHINCYSERFGSWGFKFVFFAFLFSPLSRSTAIPHRSLLLTQGNRCCCGCFLQRWLETPDFPIHIIGFLVVFLLIAFQNDWSTINAPNYLTLVIY